MAMPLDEPAEAQLTALAATADLRNPA